MTGVAATIAVDQRETQSGFTVQTLAAGLLGLFAVDNLLLLHFWGLSLPFTAGLAFVAGSALAALCARFPATLPRVSYRTVGGAFVLALALFALGGQGGFFYANVDWQVRDAVLRDMATNPWPFAYDLHGTAYFLRAPLGMYLMPAMFGAHAETALLLWSSLRLAFVLALAWHLFGTIRERLTVLAVFILFSGWDLVGTAFYSALGAHPSWDHLEPWNQGYQYSSTVTLAFWAPQHAIAGWTCAIAFLLWRKGLAPVGLFAATIPLVAIWSPLAFIGAIPFAVFAGLEVVRRRAFSFRDVAIAALALAAALPALIYLQIGASGVGMQLRPTSALVWFFCVLLEVLPFAYPLLRRASPAVDRPVIVLVLGLLLLMPLIQIGQNVDFQMRASIMPLALLAISFGEWFYRVSKEKPAHNAAMAYAIAAISLGAATPVLEIRRAVVNPPSPRPLCSLIGVWTKQDNMIAPYASYLAPVAMLPAGMRDVPVIAGRSDPDKCWDRDWRVPEGWPAEHKRLS